MHGLSELGALAYGVVGGVLPEFLAVYRRRHEPQIPEWFRRWSWWLPTITMILAGGGLAAVYVSSGVNLNPLLALNIGAATPLILGSLSSVAPSISPGNIG
jgi:hypothetical protein